MTKPLALLLFVSLKNVGYLQNDYIIMNSLVGIVKKNSLRITNNFELVNNVKRKKVTLVLFDEF